MQREVWVFISGYESYQVSNTGRVFSILMNREIFGSIDSSGYQVVRLVRKDKKKRDLGEIDFGIKKYVHILVAEAFTESIPIGMKVYHKDNNKGNNNINNLIWSPSPERNYSYNINYDLEYRVDKKVAQIYCPETDQVFYTQKECAIALGVSQPVVSRCLHSDGKYTVKGKHLEWL